MRIGSVSYADDGYSKKQYFLTNQVAVRYSNLNELLRSVPAKIGDTLGIAYSGRYFVRKEDGWWETSDTEACDAEHGLPPEGRLFLAMPLIQE